MARPKKDIKRFACSLRRTTYNELHRYANSRGMALSFITENAIVNYIALHCSDFSRFERFKNRAIREIFGIQIEFVPYSCNLSCKTIESLDLFAKKSGIRKSVIAELALTEYLRLH